MKKVAVLLSGCGNRDGSEIHESTLSLLSIEKSGMSYDCFAIDRNQTETISYLNGRPLAENRNMLEESGRIARGRIASLTKLSVADYDALWIPGGLGAAKNLCSYYYQGPQMSVDADVENVINAFHDARKPVVALCIAPMIVAKVLGAEVTIGVDETAANNVHLLGGKNVARNVDEICIDTINKVITSPCYMSTEHISDIWKGIEKAGEALAEMLKK